MFTARPYAWIAAAIVTMLCIGFFLLRFVLPSGSVIDPNNPAQVALGRMVYGEHCARCHGTNLEGEPNWMQRKPSGRLPAPPHDASGHTWHHPDEQLIGMVQNGLAPYAPPGYQSDMPAFKSMLSDDEIRAVLAFIKSSWPNDVRERQQALSR